MYSIGEVSTRSGVNIETIRYYERQGILPAPERSESGRRQYDADGLSRLRFVKKCRDLGFSMVDAKALLGLAGNDRPSCGEAKPIAMAHLEAIDAKMKELSRLHDALEQMVSMCGDLQAPCPMLQVLFEADGKTV